MSDPIEAAAKLHHGSRQLAAHRARLPVIPWADLAQRSKDELIEAMRAAIGAYEAAAWCSDMSKAPREADILVAKMPIGWWSRATVWEDGSILIHGGQWTPTHWRLPPPGPVVR